MNSLLYFAQTTADEMFTDTTLTSSGADQVATQQELMSLIFTIFMVTVIAFVVFGLPIIINLWKLFSKAGEQGWKAIIPFYNYYIVGKIAGNTTLALVYIGVSLIPFVSFFALIPLIMLMIPFIKKYKASVVYWVLFFLFPWGAVFMLKEVEFIGGTSAQTPAPIGYGGQPIPPTQYDTQSVQPIAPSNQAVPQFGGAQPTAQEGTPVEPQVGAIQPATQGVASSQPVYQPTTDSPQPTQPSSQGGVSPVAQQSTQATQGTVAPQPPQPPTQPLT